MAWKTEGHVTTGLHLLLGQSSAKARPEPTSGSPSLPQPTLEFLLEVAIF